VDFLTHEIFSFVEIQIVLELATMYT